MTSKQRVEITIGDDSFSIPVTNDNFDDMVQYKIKLYGKALCSTENYKIINEILESVVIYRYLALRYSIEERFKGNDKDDKLIKVVEDIDSCLSSKDLYSVGTSYNHLPHKYKNYFMFLEVHYGVSIQSNYF